MEYQEHLERVELPSARVKMGNVYYLQLLVYSMSSRRETVRQKSKGCEIVLGFFFLSRFGNFFWISWLVPFA